jgi:hypothetical protein
MAGAEPGGGAGGAAGRVSGATGVARNARTAPSASSSEALSFVTCSLSDLSSATRNDCCASWALSSAPRRAISWACASWVLLTSFRVTRGGAGAATACSLGGGVPLPLAHPVSSAAATP